MYQKSSIDIFKIYSELTKDCPINKIGEDINYYQSDKLGSNLLVRNCIELDMSSAFPNICRYLFAESDPQFIENLNKIDVKKEKNIFLSNYLKNKDANRNYLIELTNYAKIFTLGHIYNNYSNIDIIEFKKDGALFTGELKTIKNKQWEDFSRENNFTYHREDISFYCRYLKTSIYKKINSDEIVVKGIYKNPPKYIEKNVLPKLIINNDIFGNDLVGLKTIYSRKFLNILHLSELFEDIKNYYAFNENKYISSRLKLEPIVFGPKIIEIIEPFLTLKQFIYPLLSLLRLEK
jgi:hypothetical protein